MDSQRQTLRAAQTGSEHTWADVIADGGSFAQLRTVADASSNKVPRTSRLSAKMPEEAQAELERVSRNEPFLNWTALVAGAALYLNRYAQDESIGFAAPTRKEMPAAAPNLVFPVVLEVSPHATFREFLQSCRWRLACLYKKSPVPVEKLVEAGFRASNSRCPFQVAIAYDGLHNPLPDAAADLCLNFGIHDGALLVNATFNDSLLTERTVIDLLSGQFELLHQGLSRPGLPCSELSVFAPERAKDFYRQTKPLGDGGSIEGFVECFQRIASQQPHAAAIREKESSVSYGELDRRSEEWAAFLISQRFPNESVVGVMMNRTAMAITAILGIWKAGAVYLPCDPALPPLRFAQMLVDSGAQLLLTDRDVSLPPGCSVKVVRIEELKSQGAISKTRRPPIDLERLAYVIYTSGSTGRPKGVLLTHRGLANLVRAQQQVFTPEECHNVLQFSSHGFDASIFDIVMALGHGGTLHMTGDLRIPTGEQLFTVLRDQQITLATIPPCVVATLAEGELPTLQTLVVAGEACPEGLAEKWSKRVRFINAYGPTETTVWATYEQCRSGNPVTIGAPIPGCQTYVLDQFLQPLPPGCPGELCLGGENLARGFLGLPAKTAQHFVPNPLLDDPGKRLYRTGDLVVLGHDGRIHFLGRTDDQYKIRGYRIELGEIEAALYAHPNLEETAVVVKGASSDLKMIVAYAVAKKGFEVSSDDLRAFVGARLPDYMVPSQFVILDQIPLTSSGKVDRKALGQLEAKKGAHIAEQERPENQIEEALALMWAELLKVDRVGPTEDFFHLGGDSLVAIQVVSRINKRFGVHLSARAVFDAPTIRAMGNVVEEESRTLQARTVFAHPLVAE